MKTYVALVYTAVKEGTHEEVTDQLHQTILPASHDLDWEPQDTFSTGPNPATAAIAYALDGERQDWDNDNAMRFLELWNEGSFQEIRDNWTDIPDEVFIGAEQDFVPTTSKDQ